MPLLEPIRDPRKKRKLPTPNVFRMDPIPIRPPVPLETDDIGVEDFRIPENVPSNVAVGVPDAGFEGAKPVFDDRRRERIQTALLVALGVGAAGAIGGGDLGDSLLALGAGGASQASEMLGGLDEEYAEQMDAYREGVQELIRDQERQAALTERTRLTQEGIGARQEDSQAHSVEQQELRLRAQAAAAGLEDARQDSDDLIGVLERSGDVQGLAGAYMRVNPALSPEQAFASAQATVARFRTDTLNRQRLSRGPVGRRSSGGRSGGRSRGRSTQFSRGVAGADIRSLQQEEHRLRGIVDGNNSLSSRQGAEEDLRSVQARLEGLYDVERAATPGFPDGPGGVAESPEFDNAFLDTADPQIRSSALEAAARFWGHWEENGFSEEFFNAMADNLEDMVDAGELDPDVLDLMLQIVIDKGRGR